MPGAACINQGWAGGEELSCEIRISREDATFSVLPMMASKLVVC